MKRFYKFLMPLVAIVAMALPVSVAAQISCPITVAGTDSYGDGWNGGTLTIAQGGTTIGTFTLSDGSNGSQNFVVSDGTPVTFNWSAGSYDDEVTIQIFDGSNTMVFTVTEPSSGLIYTLTDANCPACPGITGLHVDSLTSDYARITWAGSSSDNFAYEWDEAATYVPGSGSYGTTTDNYAELTSLSVGTSYIFKVWRDCGVDGTSDTATLLFHTTALSATLPYSTGFELAEDQGWEFVNDATNKWYIDSAVNNGGTYSLYISNNNGSSNAYTNNSTQFSYAYRTFTVDNDGQFGISFDWRCYGEGNYDYLRAWIAPAMIDLQAGHDPQGGTSAYNYTTSTPAGWIDLGGKMNLQSNWQTTQALPNLTAGTYNLVFMWANDGSGGTQPPAAVDNVMIRELSCRQPQNFAVAYLSPDTLTLTWTPGGSESMWQVTNGVDTVEVTDTTYTFDTLTANTNYNVRIRSICDGGDTSLWLSMVVRTPCTFIDSLPYFTSFEDASTGSSSSFTFGDPCWMLVTDATDYPYVYVSSSSSYAHSGGKGIYWYRSSTAGGSYGMYQCLVLPGVTVSDEHPVSSMQIKFWAKNSSSSYNAQFKVGVMTNPSDINTFTEVGSINTNYSTEWTEYVVALGNYTGTGNFVAIRANYNGNYWYAYLDDVTLEYAPTCPPITAIDVVGTTTSGAYITWGYQPGLPGIPEQYDIEYLDLDDSTASPVAATATDPYIFITGLMPETHYQFKVRVDCGDDDITPWDSTVFSTVGFGCAVIDSTTSDTVIFTNSTTGYSGCLAYSSWGNTVYQTVYTPEELTAAGVSAGPITGIDLGFTGSTYPKEFTIFMGNTSTNYINNATIENPQTLVYGPAAHPANTSGWQHYDFTAPFIWDGSSSILLTTFMNQPAGTSQTSSSSLTGYYVSASNKARFRYKDSNPFTVNDINSGSAGSSYNYRASIHFYTLGCEQSATCAAPTAGVLDVDSVTVTVGWAPGASETSWNTNYRQYGDSVWTPAGTDVTTTTYTFTGLTPGTIYEFQIVNSCTEGDFSTVVGATTACAPFHLPLTEDFELSNGVYAPDCWVNGTTYLGSSYPNPIVVSLTGDPNKLLLVYNGGYLIFPQVAAPLNQLQIRFKFIQGGDNVHFLMGLMPNQELPIDSIIVLDTLVRSEIDTTSSTVYITYPFSGINPDYNDYHIAFWDAFNENYSFLDDIVVEYIPVCSPVSDLTVSAGTTTADLTWTAATSGTSYIIEYGPHNFTLGTGTTVTVTGSPATLTGLNHSTTYDVYMYTICGANDTSTASPKVEFTTACAPIVTLPYVMNFENIVPPGTGSTTVIMPNCWATETVSAGTAPRIYYTTNTSMAPSQPYSLYFYDLGVAAMPEMGMPLNTLMINFHAYNATPNQYGIVFGAVDSIAPGYASSFEPIDTVVFEYGSNGEFELVSFLNGYTGTANHIAIRNYNVDSNATYATVYIDDITVSAIPSCIPPQRVHTTALTNVSADLEWTISNGSSYNIEYGPHGFTPGTGLTTTSTTQSVALTGLNPFTEYDVRLVSVCSATEHSDTTVFTFTTLRAAPVMSLPYYCDFADSAMANAWEPVNGTEANIWVLGSAAYYGTGDTNALYVTNDNGANNSYAGAAAHTYVYRTFALDPGNYNFSFMWRAQGEGSGTYAYDYIRAYLVPASQTIVAGVCPDGGTSSYSNAFAAPQAGWIALGGNAPLVQQSTWQNFSDDVDITAAGSYHLVFYWGNDGSVYNNPAGAVDNISVARNVCPITDIQLDTATGSTMTISWTASSTSYNVEYGPVGFAHGAGTMVSTTNTHATLTGLTSLTNYDIYVRGICNGDADTSRWYYASYSTAMCDNAVNIQNWDTSMTATTSSYSPIGYSFYNYSYTQTIIDAATMAGFNGDITAFAYYPTSTAAGDKFNNMDVYMANVSDSNLSGGFIMPDSAHTFVQVISNGNLCYTTSGEQIASFDTPFTWDGYSNVLFVVNRKNGSYTSGATFEAHNQASGMMRYAYTDSAPYDPTTVSGGYESSTVGDIRLISCGDGNCEAPAVTIDTVGELMANIHWMGSSSSYEVAIVQGTTWIEPAAGTAVADSFYTFTGLTEMTDYIIGVRGVCGNSYSEWTTLPVTTLRHPCAVPTGITVTDNTYDGATVSWNIGENETEWEVMVFCASPVFEHVYNVSENPTYTVTGLDDSVTYSVAVRAVCDPTWKSVWSDTVALATANCPQVTGVSASGITSSAATINWTSNEAVRYEIEYGDMGFPEGTGTVVTSQTNSVNLSNLESESTYDVYVRGFCTETVSSNWSARYRFTTATQGIDDVEGSNVTLFPNPASTMVTIRGIEGESTVTVVDLNGREVFKTNADNTLTIDLTGYAKGAYFVRITGERTTAIRKLVVK